MAIAISSCFNGCAIDKFGFSLCEQVNLRVVCCISIRRTKSVRNCKFAINHVRRIYDFNYILDGPIYDIVHVYNIKYVRTIIIK